MKYALALAVLLVACGNSKPAAPPPETPAQPQPQASHGPVEQKQVSSNVNLSSDILAACKIEFSNPGEAPKFDYDSTKLAPDDEHVLAQVATCLTTGPLKGRAVQLVGRADPRGSDQYNMALGANRAHQVSDFLKSHGVTTLTETSRGAIDAQGHDEESYRKDRRVDLVLQGS
ncbi:MAG TPA: OmpA family protein [Polyangiaceae bacterium]|jgi:peptidoglycan-associated lipoprotein